MSELDCLDAYDDSENCQGEVLEELSTTGATTAARCRYHRKVLLDRMAKVHKDISSRYPGYDTPGSLPPPDFDPMYAGERWDEDD